MLTLNKDSETDGLVFWHFFQMNYKVVILAGRAKRERREMISGATFSVADMASGVFFIVLSFIEFFSLFRVSPGFEFPSLLRPRFVFPATSVQENRYRPWCRTTSDYYGLKCFCLMASFSYPRAHLFLSETLCSQSFFPASLGVPFTSFCGQLPFRLCFVAFAVYCLRQYNVEVE